MNDMQHGDELAKVMLHYGIIDTIHSSQMKVMCPFHRDQNPSMSVNFEDGFWFCFGCQEFGDAEKFVKKIEKQENGVNDLKALAIYQRIIKGSVGGYKGKVIRRTPEELRRDKRHYYDMAYDFYHGLAKVSWTSSECFEEVEHAREYMSHRGFEPETLDLARAKVTFKKNYEIIFPMMDNGKFKGWVCRTTIPEIEQKRKYLYNKGFSRATTLVGDYGVFWNELDKYVIVCEGYMDMLKFLQFGVKNAVAILGWKMTENQIQKLNDKGIELVVSALDNDECGRKGTKFLRKHFEVVRFPYLKGLKDPGDMDEKSFKKMYKKMQQRLHQLDKKGRD